MTGVLTPAQFDALVKLIEAEAKLAAAARFGISEECRNDAWQARQAARFYLVGSAE